MYLSISQIYNWLENHWYSKSKLNTFEKLCTVNEIYEFEIDRKYDDTFEIATFNKIRRKYHHRFRIHPPHYTRHKSLVKDSKIQFMNVSFDTDPAYEFLFVGCCILTFGLYAIYSYVYRYFLTKKILNQLGKEIVLIGLD